VEGRQLLQSAFELGNEHAAIELFMIYDQGGWCVYPNKERAAFYSNVIHQSQDPLIQIVTRRVNNREERFRVLYDAVRDDIHVWVLWAMANQYKKDGDKDTAKIWYQKAANKRVASACSEMLRFKCDTSEERSNFLWYASDACHQCHFRSILHVFNWGWSRGNYRLATTSPHATVITYEILEDKLGDTPSDECKYFVGKAVVEVFDRSKYPRLFFARLYYREVALKTQASVITWLLVAKKIGLYKDVARLIGKMIRGYEEVYTVWNLDSLEIKKRLKR
jgi:hypothetical protein